MWWTVDYIAQIYKLIFQRTSLRFNKKIYFFLGLNQFLWISWLSSLSLSLFSLPLPLLFYLSLFSHYFSFYFSFNLTLAIVLSFKVFSQCLFFSIVLCASCLFLEWKSYRNKKGGIVSLPMSQPWVISPHISRVSWWVSRVRWWVSRVISRVSWWVRQVRMQWEHIICIKGSASIFLLILLYSFQSSELWKFFYLFSLAARWRWLTFRTSPSRLVKSYYS